MATTKATTLAHTLGGISSDISTAEINRLDGLTGDIQTLLNLKAPIASPTFTGTADISSGATFPSNPTVTLGANTTFPSGHIIGTEFVYSDAHTSITNNSSTTVLTKTFNRKSGSSHFIYTLSIFLASYSGSSNADADDTTIRMQMNGSTANLSQRNLQNPPSSADYGIWGTTVPRWYTSGDYYGTYDGTYYNYTGKGTLSGSANDSVTILCFVQSGSSASTGCYLNRSKSRDTNGGVSSLLIYEVQ